MFVICYKINQEPVTIRDVKFVSVYETNIAFADRISELGLLDKYPDAIFAKENLLTVTGMCSDGSMVTVYDVIGFEGE